jgi:hypothetical protein
MRSLFFITWHVGGKAGTRGPRRPWAQFLWNDMAIDFARIMT